MNKKLFSALVVGALLVLGTPAQAAPAKIGSSCSKSGAVTAVSKSKLVCSKVGKKLIWKKAPTESKKPTGSEESTKAFAPISLDNLDINQVRKQAYANVYAAIQASKAYIPNITYVIGPSLSRERVNSEKTGLDMASAFWSDIYKPEHIFVGYISGEDVDWVDKAYCEQAKYCPSGNDVVVSSVVKQEWPNCNGAQATQNQDQIPFFNQCLGTGSDGLKNKQTGPHEYMHFAQADVSRLDPSVPNWWTEGSADYFGGAIGAYDGTQFPTTLDEMFHATASNWVAQDLCDLGDVTEATVVKCFKYTYRQAGPPGKGSRWMLAHVSYYQGSLATEALVALYGVDKTKKFMTDIRSIGFESSFRENFGITSEVFYRKVAKYVVAMYNANR